ncbi:MAG: hypothetical protein ACYC6A_10790 [Armatimonadota bacterium]
MMQACIPMAIQVVIDDVGWWCGENGSARGEPFRTACPRDHVPADYLAIIELGRRLGMRPQAAMVLCEWDRTNLLRGLPNSTWMGDAWDNTRWQGPWLDEAAALLQDHRDHVEIVLHGIGHEFWVDGAVERAEWHDRQGRMRAKGDVRAHLDFYARLLEQNGLGSVPVSFVPAAFLHRFGGELAPILAEYGIRYISTPFGTIFRSRETEAVDFGIDAGIITVDRGRDLFNWHITGPMPQGEIDGPVCGMHWPNLLHEDPARNAEVVDGWVRLLQPYDTRFDRMLAPDTAAAFSQLVYHRWTEVTWDERGISLDFKKVDAAGAKGVLDTFYLKVRSDSAAAFAADGMEILESQEEMPRQWRLHLHRSSGCGSLHV